MLERSAALDNCSGRGLRRGRSVAVLTVVSRAQLRIASKAPHSQHAPVPTPHQLRDAAQATPADDALPDRMTYSGSTSYCNLGCDTSCNKGCNSGRWGSCDNPRRRLRRTRRLRDDRRDLRQHRLLQRGRSRPAAPNRRTATVHRQPWLRLESARRRVNCLRRHQHRPTGLLLVRERHDRATVDDYDDNECVAISSRRRVDCTAASTTGDAEWQTCAAATASPRDGGSCATDPLKTCLIV